MKDRQESESRSYADADVVMISRHRRTHLNELNECLERVARNIQPFQDLLRTATVSELSKIELPADGAKAWLHLLMSLVLGKDKFVTFERHILRCNDLLGESVRKILTQMIPRSLLDDLVLAPIELALLINFQLLQDVTSSLPDVGLSYWQYFKRLVSFRLVNLTNSLMQSC